MLVTDAVNQKGRTIVKCAVGLELLEQTDIIDRNAIDTAAMAAGVIGGDDTVNANTAAVKFLEVITGATDPFSIPTMTSTAIAERLECEEVPITVHGKKGETEQHELRLSATMKKQVVESYEEWILTKPSLHTPFRLFKGGHLSLTKAMIMLDNVLATMYDMTYKRARGRKLVNGEFVYTYAASESEDFPRVNADYSFHKTKPSIPRWADAPLGDLYEGQILQLSLQLGAKRHLQLGTGYTDRQGAGYNSFPLPGIHPCDLDVVGPKRHRA